MNVLFVCNMARMRSATAAHCLRGMERDFAGTDEDADRQITQDLMDWADKIVCMERHHRNKLRRKYKGHSHKMVVWDIPDEYNYLDDVLITRLRGKAEDMLGELNVRSDSMD